MYTHLLKHNSSMPLRDTSLKVFVNMHPMAYRSQGDAVHCD